MGVWLAFGLLAACHLSVAAVDDEVHHDRLWLRQGDPWVGQLLNPSLEMQTPYARLQVPVSQVSSANFAEGPEQLDRIFLVPSGRLSGFLLEPEIRFQPRSGSLLTMRCDRVARITLHRQSALPEPSREVPRRLLFFRNGDTMSGRILDGPFRVSTPQTDVMLAVEDLVSVSFSDTHPVLAEVGTVQGEKLEGVWPDRELQITLDIGPTIRVYPSRISSIDTRFALRTEGLRADTRDSLTDPASSTGSVTNDPSLIWVPPGEFLMGSPSEEADRDLDEGPQTRVRISHGFWMGRCEVTQAQYREVMGVNPSLFVGDARRPVEKVRYRDALEFCDRLTRLHLAGGRLPEECIYRLPTEAEWEYACRAGTETRYSHGDDPRGYELEAYAWFNGNSDSSTQPVGTRQPNPWGFHDLHGNVLEWCLDGATSTLPGGEVQDPVVPVEGLLHVARGGSWLYGAKASRSANRDSYGESTRSSDLGFRIVLAPVR
jgi:formylglycine-generating enzyme required for sulfatase activity